MCSAKKYFPDSFVSSRQGGRILTSGKAMRNLLGVGECQEKLLLSCYKVHLLQVSLCQLSLPQDILV